jgi:hypothetical protein
MIRNWLLHAHPGAPWVCTYVFACIFLVFWTPLATLLAIPVYGLAEFPEFMSELWQEIWIFIGYWPNRPRKS